MAGQSIFRVSKEMGISHKDFFRILPRVMDGKDYRADGNRVELSEGERQLEIRLGEEWARTLGPIVSIPVTQVELIFTGYEEAEREAFLRHFDRQYFKGGG